MIAKHVTLALDMSAEQRRKAATKAAEQVLELVAGLSSPASAQEWKRHAERALELLKASYDDLQTQAADLKQELAEAQQQYEAKKTLVRAFSTEPSQLQQLPERMAIVAAAKHLLALRSKLRVELGRIPSSKLEAEGIIHNLDLEIQELDVAYDEFGEIEGRIARKLEEVKRAARKLRANGFTQNTAQLIMDEIRELERQRDEVNDKRAALKRRILVRKRVKLRVQKITP